MRQVLAIILAGGKGSRLEPLTLERAKPAVPFGGSYRIIDFTLSNCINSELRKILVLTQYKAVGLDRHINRAWRFLCRELDEFIDICPPEQRLGEKWYSGTADAVYQNIYSIERVPSEQILILSGDHIYKMDYSEMLRDHMQSGADATIGCLPVPIAEGNQFGIMGIDSTRRVVRFDEKPEAPTHLPGDPTRCLASMGIYAFKTKFLLDELIRDGTQRTSQHDFGKDLLPRMIREHDVRAFPFIDKNTGKTAYWRDVGTLDAYYEANMDLVGVEPELNLYDTAWPIRGYHPPLPPPKFVFGDWQTAPPRYGHAIDSMVSPGCIISGGKVQRSILFNNVRVNSYAQVESSILFENVIIGRHCRLRKVIVDKGIVLDEGTEIGFDPIADRDHGYTVSAKGVTVVSPHNTVG